MALTFTQYFWKERRNAMSHDKKLNFEGIIQKYGEEDMRRGGATTLLMDPLTATIYRARMPLPMLPNLMEDYFSLDTNDYVHLMVAFHGRRDRMGTMHQSKFYLIKPTTENALIRCFVDMETATRPNDVIKQSAQFFLERLSSEVEHAVPSLKFHKSDIEDMTGYTRLDFYLNQLLAELHLARKKNVFNLSQLFRAHKMLYMEAKQIYMKG